MQNRPCSLLKANSPEAVWIQHSYKNKTLSGTKAQGTRLVKDLIAVATLGIATTAFITVGPKTILEEQP